MKCLCKRRYAGLVLAALMIACCSCRHRGQERVADARSSKGKPTVYVVNYPLQYLAERIGGSLVDVRFPAPADVDPAYWEPSVDVIAGYQEADVVLLNGAGYAGWTRHVTLPETRLRLTTQSVADRLIPINDAVSHQHGPEGEHEHEGTAFTTWLDPTIAMEQARQVHDALLELLPDNASTLHANFEELAKDLRKLDQDLESLTATNPTIPLVFSHPVYQYLTRRYHLNAREVHWEPGTLPDELAWGQLQELLAAHPARWMIWEGEPLPEVVDRLQSMGLGSVVFSPWGNRPASGDYLTAMKANVDHLRRVFELPKGD